MKNNLLGIILIILFFIAIIFSSCEKQKIHNLRGDWKLASGSSTDTVIWRFDFNDTVFSINGNTITKGLYLYDYGLTKSYITFSNFSYTERYGNDKPLSYTLNEKWTVTKLNKKTLVIVSIEGVGQSSREFERVGDLDE